MLGLLGIGGAVACTSGGPVYMRKCNCQGSAREHQQLSPRRSSFRRHRPAAPRRLPGPAACLLHVRHGARLTGGALKRVP